MNDRSRDLCSRLFEIRHAYGELLDGQDQALPPDLADKLLAVVAEASRLSLPDVAETARSLAAFQVGLGQQAPDEQNLGQIRLLLGNLVRRLCPESLAGDEYPDSALVTQIAPSGTNTNERVALYLESRAVSALLHDALKMGGFDPFPIQSMEQLAASEYGTAPAAIVADLSLCRNDPHTRKTVQTLREIVVPAPHLFCLAHADDFPARLEAIRLGATRFLSKPLDTEKLLAVLRGVTDRTPHEPYRVLLVDDDPAMTLVHGAHLAEIGIEVREVNHPAEALAAAEAFRPDVIVMDVYMPGCNGLELAGILRQDETLADTPILFLSAETNIHRQMLAMDLGGDDFQTKPVTPEVFQASVVARAKRARMLKRTRTECRQMASQLNSLMPPQQSPRLSLVWRLDSMRRLLVSPTGSSVRLSALEVSLIQHMGACPGHHASREHLIATLADTHGAYDGPRLEALISRLRRKSTEKCGMKLPILSEYGRGYSFAARIQIL
ncbi:MAG: response regulator [Rhodocyclaceae bacterium]|nr:response regulator [Rhodocyclaceae bacterium]